MADLVDSINLRRPPAGTLVIAALDSDVTGFSFSFDTSDPELLAKLYKMADGIYRHVTERKSELCQK